jgi:hypothetical protein
MRSLEKISFDGTRQDEHILVRIPRISGVRDITWIPSAGSGQALQLRVKSGRSIQDDQPEEIFGRELISR